MARLRVEGKPSSQVPQKPGTSSDGLALVVIWIVAAGVLAMLATWFLVADFPIPDDEVIHLGLILALFILFLVLPVAVSKFLHGRGTAAVKSSIGWLLVGLFAALAVGSLPWLQRRLIAAIPWVQDIPWIVLLVSCLTASLLWRSRRLSWADSFSRKQLIAWGIPQILIFMLSLASAVFGFSGGKIWSGILYLMLALLSGFLAVKVFVEVWRRREPHESVSS